MLQGIFTPNIVPFHSDHRVNEGELRRMIDWLIQKGVSGLYPNGSTGEFIRLSFEQRKQVVRIVADETRGRVPILAGAAEPNLDLILEAAKEFADLGCRAISVTGPYYFKVSQESIETYFRELAAKSPIDIVLYNIPQFSNEISLEVVRRLASDCPRIVGIKDSSRDFPRFLDTLNEIKPGRPDFSCLVGCEEMLFPVLMMGGDGGTVASSGVAPEAVMKLYNEFLRGNFDECKRIQFKLLEVIKTMFAAGNFPEGFRAGVALRGFDVGPSMQPMGPAEMRKMEEFRTTLACLLGQCGFEEAAQACRAGSGNGNRPAQAPSNARFGGEDLERIVQAVVQGLKKS